MPLGGLMEYACKLVRPGQSVQHSFQTILDNVQRGKGRLENIFGLAVFWKENGLGLGVSIGRDVPPSIEGDSGWEKCPST